MAPRHPAAAAGLLLLFASAVTLSAAAFPAEVAAVAGRDVEGSVVVDADSPEGYLPTAAACRDACRNTTGCNLWVYCSNTRGCGGTGDYDRDLGRYRQCWLKFDNPTSRSWPRAKTSRDQSSGWMSGTTAANFTDSAGTDIGYSRCTCSSSYTAGGYKFQGVCANPDGSGLRCNTNRDCKYPPSSYDGGAPSDGCYSPQPCLVAVDTHLDAEEVITRGDQNYQESPEACCAACANTPRCNVWTWCSDPNGCDEKQLYRFRQCWLKYGASAEPVTNSGYGKRQGWISGHRAAFLPA